MEKESLTQAATEVIGWLREGKEFAQEQAPEVAEQMVMWAVVSNAVGSVVFSIIAVVFALFARWLWKKFNEEGQKYTACDLGAFFASAVSALSLLCSFCCLMGVLKPLVAPKLYVIEQLAKLAQ